MFIGAYIAAVTLTSFWTFIAWRNAVDYNTIYQKNQGVNFNDHWDAKGRAYRWHRQYRFAMKVLVGLLLGGIGVGIFSLVAL